MANEQYVQRHDGVCAQLHFNIYQEAGVKLDNEHWYDRLPELVETSREGKATILRDQQVHTGRFIPNNEPYIISRDNEKGTRILIDVAIAGDRNVIKKEAEKIV